MWYIVISMLIWAENRWSAEVLYQDNPDCEEEPAAVVCLPSDVREMDDLYSEVDGDIEVIIALAWYMSLMGTHRTHVPVFIRSQTVKQNETCQHDYTLPVCDHGKLGYCKC